MLLAHSMGTPYSAYFLRNQTKEWKDKYLKAWMTISGNFIRIIHKRIFMKTTISFSDCIDFAIFQEI